MQTTTNPRRRVKAFHPTSFTAFTANALALAEERSEQHNRFRAQPDARGEVPRVTCFQNARCCAYTDAGNICNVTPAPFYDLARGGFVCADHRPLKGGGV